MTITTLYATHTEKVIRYSRYSRYSRFARGRTFPVARDVAELAIAQGATVYDRQPGPFFDARNEPVLRAFKVADEDRAEAAAAMEAL